MPTMDIRGFSSPTEWQLKSTEDEHSQDYNYIHRDLYTEQLEDYDKIDNSAELIQDASLIPQLGDIQKPPLDVSYYAPEKVPSLEHVIEHVVSDNMGLSMHKPSIQ